MPRLPQKKSSRPRRVSGDDRLIWKSVICEAGNEVNPVVAQRYDIALNELEMAGYEVRFVLPNGINRLTIVGRRQER